MSHFSTLQSLLVLIIHVCSLSDGSVWPSTLFLVLLWSSICMYVCVYVVVVNQSTCSLHIYCYIRLIYKWLAHLIGIILSRRQINCSRMFSLYYIYTYIFIYKSCRQHVYRFNCWIPRNQTQASAYQKQINTRRENATE